MTATKHRPTFHIIENYQEEIDMDAFEKDYLNPHTSVESLRKKYDLGQFRYNRLAKEIREKNGLSRKPFKFSRADGSFPTFNGRFIDDMRYIRVWEKSYSIQKVIDGNKYRLGTFEDLETAQRVRDYLISCDWDIDEFYRLKEKYKYARIPTALKKAEEKYPIWKKYYLNSLMSIGELNRMMNITDKMYYYLRKMIHEEYNISKRPYKNKRGGL